MRYSVGLFINPHSFEMATGTYSDGSSGVKILAISRDKYSSDIALGSIDDGTVGEEYTHSAELTGYPRAHSSPGVEPEYRGQRWGTCLYVAEAETARAKREGQLQFPAGVIGSLDGISSQPKTRSAEAEKWWKFAKKDGLAQSVRKCDEEGKPKKKCETIDILTSLSCRSHKLVAASCGARSLLEYDGVPPLFWQLKEDQLLADFSYKSGTTRDALLSANVGYLATEDFGKKAMENYVKIMRAVRCSDEQIRDKVALFNAKVDVTAPEYIRQEWMIQNPPAVDVIRRRRGKKVEYLMSNPKHAIVPTKIAPPRIVFYGPRPNPDALPKGVQKALERLYDRRLEAGYGALQNLP